MEPGGVLLPLDDEELEAAPVPALLFLCVIQP